jgi:creatinine amidohydrolase/Fe(II)-dependent formamide hydrolase-like protein
MAQLKNSPDEEAIRKTILKNGVTWPWTTDDRRLADTGVIGDAKSASAEFGQQIVNRVVETAGGVLKQLLDNQRFLRR